MAELITYQNGESTLVLSAIDTTVYTSGKRNVSPGYRGEPMSFHFDSAGNLTTVRVRGTDISKVSSIGITNDEIDGLLRAYLPDTHPHSDRAAKELVSQDMIDAACEAEEQFSLDELEQYAAATTH